MKKAGRKPKKDADKVKSKGVYLKASEWKLIEKKYGSGTGAMRIEVLPKLLQNA